MVLSITKYKNVLVWTNHPCTQETDTTAVNSGSSWYKQKVLGQPHDNQPTNKGSGPDLIDIAYESFVSYLGINIH